MSDVIHKLLEYYKCYSRVNYFFSSPFLPGPINALIKAVTIESTMLNHNAAHQFTTVKPGTILADHLIRRILITSKNKPSVSMVIGMVRIIKIGFTKLLSSASTTAKSIALNPLSKWTPFIFTCNQYPSY